MLGKLLWKLCSEVVCLAPSQAFGQYLQRGTGRSFGLTTRAKAGAMLHLSNELIVFHVVLLFGSTGCWSPSFRLLPGSIVVARSFMTKWQEPEYRRCTSSRMKWLMGGA